MKIPFGDMFLRFIPSVVRFAANFYSSVRSGEFWRNLKAWWGANWDFALISLVFASLVFYQVNTTISDSETADVEFVVKLECQEYPDAYIAAEPGKVGVRVKGDLRDIRTFETSKKSTILLPVNKDKAKEGAVVRIHPKNIPGLKGLKLQVVSISPDELKVKFDGRASVDFRIARPEFYGTPYHGEVKSWKVEPEIIKLRGQSSRLQSLAQTVDLSVPTINVGNLAVGEIEKVCDIVVPPEISPGDYDFISDEKVTVKFTIAKSEKSEAFSALPLRLSLPPPKPGETSLPDGYRLEPETVNAKITGYDVSVEALSNATITAYAFVADRSSLDLSPEATNRVPVRIEVPHDKEISEVIPTPPEVLLIMPPPAEEPLPALSAETDAEEVPEFKATEPAETDAEEVPELKAGEPAETVPAGAEGEPVPNEEKAVKENQDSEK